jgi:hypothetical protein
VDMSDEEALQELVEDRDGDMELYD